MKQKSPKESKIEIKKLVAKKKAFHRTDFKPGNLLFYGYTAKFKDVAYDKTPMVLILGTSTSHTLGLNFHWIPFSMRIWLVQHIIRINKANIKAGKPIEFSYRKLKPLLKKLHYAPCIRLYINKRISHAGVVIPPERLHEAAKLDMGTITGIPTKVIYKKALMDAKKRKKGKK